MGSSHISIKEVKLDHFGEIEGVLFAKVPIVPIADVVKLMQRTTLYFVLIDTG